MFLLSPNFQSISSFAQNPAPVPATKKKNDGNRVTDFAYSAELRIVKEKLQCAQHVGPNRWCYVSPENPTEHVALGYEEISLWARKIVSESECSSQYWEVDVGSISMTTMPMRTALSRQIVSPSIIFVREPVASDKMVPSPMSRPSMSTSTTTRLVIPAVTMSLLIQHHTV